VECSSRDIPLTDAKLRITGPYKQSVTQYEDMHDELEQLNQMKKGLWALRFLKRYVMARNLATVGKDSYRLGSKTSSALLLLKDCLIDHSQSVINQWCTVCNVGVRTLSAPSVHPALLPNAYSSPVNGSIAPAIALPVLDSPTSAVANTGVASSAGTISNTPNETSTSFPSPSSTDMSSTITSTNNFNFNATVAMCNTSSGSNTTFSVNYSASSTVTLPTPSGTQYSRFHVNQLSPNQMHPPPLRRMEEVPHS